MIDSSEAARDSRREANAAIARRIGKKLNTSGARLTKDERATAALILKGVADLIAGKPLSEFERNFFWSNFDVALDVKINALLGAAWMNDDTGGVL